MGFGVRIVDEAFVPAVACDRCDGEAGPQGFALWRASPEPGAVLIACGVDCLEALTADEHATGGGDWAAVPLDAYLAGLIRRLEIDLSAVEARERAAAATEQTRREGPE